MDFLILLSSYSQHRFPGPTAATCTQAHAEPTSRLTMRHSATVGQHVASTYHLLKAPSSQLSLGLPQPARLTWKTPNPREAALAAGEPGVATKPLRAV